jgi:heavy metal sensor kinase
VKIFKSLGSRLVAGYIFFLFLTLLIIPVFYYFAVKQEMIRNARLFLAGELGTTASFFSRELKSREAISRFLSQKKLFLKGPYEIHYALFDREGLLIAKSEGFQEDDLSVGRTGAGQKDPFYRLSQRFQDSAGETFSLQLGLLKRSVTGPLIPFFRVSLFVIPAALILAVLGGILLTRRNLAPIQKLTQAARELSLQDPKRELPLSGTGDELDELAETFNRVFRRLRTSYEQIVQFTADASHELRLPITAIKGEAEIVLERERNLEEYRKVLMSIIEEFDRLSQLTHKLLVLARSDSGKDALEKETVDLRELLSKLTEFYRPLAEEKDLRIFFEGKETGSLSADPYKLQELFSNLIENAIKYTKPGGQVSLGFSKAGSEYRVSVTDSGIGIPPGEQAKIFERFYRVDRSRAREEGGMGLGLSIAESIARAHGGRILVESALGKGSIFTVVLPV